MSLTSSTVTSTTFVFSLTSSVNLYLAVPAGFCLVTVSAAFFYRYDIPIFFARDHTISFLTPFTYLVSCFYLHSLLKLIMVLIISFLIFSNFVISKENFRRCGQIWLHPTSDRYKSFYKCTCSTVTNESCKVALQDESLVPKNKADRYSSIFAPKI